MRKLVIDIGNSFRKLAVYEDKNLIELETSDEQPEQAIKDFYQGHRPFDAAIISSVASPAPEAVKYLESQPGFIELTHTTPLPVTLKYQTPETLGKDRIAAAVAAFAAFPGRDILVVDTGTAITYDMINARKEYLGGGIAPGIQMRFQALHTFTGKLPLIQRKDDPALIGKSTTDSILSGVMNGVLAEVTGIIGRYRKEFPGLQVVITGGDHYYFDNKLKNNIFALPNLVLDGLNEILDYNI